MAFSPDGERLASASSYFDWSRLGEVKVWDVTSGHEMLALKGHTGGVTSVVFSPDGDWLATAGGIPPIQPAEVKVWDARPWTADLKAELEAVGLLRLRCTEGIKKRELLDAIVDDKTLTESVRHRAIELAGPYWENKIRQRATLLLDGLFGKGLLKEEVLQAVSEDNTIPEPVRMRALELAQSRVENAVVLINACEPIVLKPDQPMEQYRLALRRVERAHRIAENNGYLVLLGTTLGVAQYRVGQYEESLKTLTRSNELNSKTLNGQQPADVAFLAMVEHKLGHKDQARAMLDRLREIMKLPQWAKDTDSRTLLHKAESLLDATPPKPPEANK